MRGESRGLWLVLTVVVTVASACDRDQSSQIPEPSIGAKYTLIAGELPFYDSGCNQDRKPDGKLVTGTLFRLVAADDGCWLVTLEDEVDTYVRPNSDLIKSRRK